MRLNPFKRAPKEEQETTKMLVMSTGELMSIGEHRSHIEKSVQRIISSGSKANDSILSAIVATSVPAMVCVNYHSNVVSSIPIVAQDLLGKEAQFVPMKGMLDNRMRWLIRDVDKSFSIWGYALIRKHYNHQGLPTLLEFLNPLDVRINTDSKQNIVDYRLNRTQEDLKLNEVIYISEFDLQNTGDPVSKLENCLPYTGLERGIVVHATSFFFNGASIAGVVSIEGTGMTAPKFEKFKKEFKRNFKGANNSFKVAILERNITYTPISVAPADLAMAELSDQSKQFVTAAFGINPSLVGLGDVTDPLSALSTFHETKQNFVEMEATPSLDFILDNMNTQWALTDFLSPVMLVSDSSAMAMMNDGISTDDMSVANTAIDSNIWTYDEAREHLGYKPFDLEDGFVIRDPGIANILYDDGTISLNQKRKMLGLKPPLVEDMIKIDGATYLLADRDTVAQSNLKNLEAPAPSPFGLSAPPAPPMLSEPPMTLKDIEIRAADYLPDGTMAMIGSNNEVVMVQGIARQVQPQLIIGVDLAGHQMINLARRELGRALSDTPGVTWVAPEHWRVELAHIDRWSASDIANMTRVIKWDFNKAEVLTGEYFINGNGVYLSLGDTDATGEMMRLVRDDLRSVAIKSNDATPAMAIKLAHGDVKQEMLPTESALGSMPIVFTRIAAFANDKIQHKWRLRAYLDKDNQALLTKQRDELSKWSMKLSRAGVNTEWDIKHLPQHVVRFVRGDSPVFNNIDLPEIDLPEGSALYSYYARRGKLTITELFDEARRMLTVRALQALRLDWENFVEALLADTRAGNIKDRARFGVLLRGEMGRFAGRAYLDGLTDGGVLDATLSDSDDKKIKTMLSDNSAFVSSLSELLFKGDGLSDAQASGKPRQWWAGSILPFYQEGFSSAGVNPMMEFVGPFGKDPCATCRHLFGQRHRLSVWNKNGLGMVGGSFVGQRTICGKGGHCKHSIMTVVARASGSIRSDDIEVQARLDEIRLEWEAIEEELNDGS